MKIQNTLSRKNTFALAALLSCFALTGTAQADHDYDILRAKADAVFHAMIDMDRPLIDSYVRSRVFGEMMATSGQIKGKAAYLRGMSYRKSPCRWTSELDKLDGLVHQMEALIESAHFRAARGLDPPISCRSAETIQRLAVITDMVHCMRDALTVAVVQTPVYRPAPVIYNHNQGHGTYGYGGYGSYNDHGHGHSSTPVYRSSGYRGGHSNHGHGGVNVNGNRGGNVHVDGGGVTIGKGGLSFRIRF